ncbi:MAG: VOC family protein [Pseudomonadota bacterium]|nr:VOC family protein [Pseudomonadota bacterium]
MKLAYTALLVPDYDEAIAFYCRAMGFVVNEDSDLGDGKRWVVIAGEDGGALLLAKARKPAEIAAVGSQFGGRVGLFAHTDDHRASRSAIEAAGGQFEEATRYEPYGKVAVFRDPFGNRWDLIEPAR